MPHKCSSVSLIYSSSLVFFVQPRLFLIGFLQAPRGQEHHAQDHTDRLNEGTQLLTPHDVYIRWGYPRYRGHLRGTGGERRVTVFGGEKHLMY